MNRVVKPWVVVLAGGSGERLRPVTTAASGRSIPKQFCRLNGRDSMLGVTLARARGVAADQHILTVVMDDHREWWEGELAGLPAGNVLSLPRNRGTALALLRAVLQVRVSDPEAPVVVLPSDHVVDHEDVLKRTIVEALDEVRRSSRHAVLIGSPSNVPDPSLGWILPGRAAAGRTREVTGFVEKPSLAVAAECVRRGALRNTMMLAANTRTLLETYALAMPDWARADANNDGRDGDPVGTPAPAMQSELPAMDLSRHVLQRCARRLRVLPLPECGWTDIGTLERLESWWWRNPATRDRAKESGIFPGASRVRPLRPEPRVAVES